MFETINPKMSDPTETAAHSDDTYMLYFELEDVEFSCDKLQKIDSCPVIIEVQFLDYPAFNLVQEESACPGRFLNFRPHQSFNLKSPKSSCPCPPELEFNFFKLRDGVCACEHIFSIQLPFDEDQRKSFQDFFNKCTHSTSFSTSGRYKLTDRDGAFSGCMTVRLRYIRCEDCPATNFPNPIPWKEPSTQSENSLEKSLDNFHHLSSAERLNFPEFRDLIYQNCLNDSADWNFLCNVEGDTDSNESLCSECKDDDDDSCGSPVMEKSSGIKVLSKKQPAGERVYECFQPDFDKNEELLILQSDSPVKLGPKPVKTKSSPKITTVISKDELQSRRDSKDNKVAKSPKSAKKNKSATTLKSKKRSEMTVNTKTSKGSRLKKGHKDAKEKDKRHQGRPEKSRSSELDDPRTAIRKMKRKFVYNLGDLYPGCGKAHQHCVDKGLRVPAKMGWRWNVRDQLDTLRPRPGWRPGALNRLLREIIQEVKTEFIESNKKKTKQSKSARQNRKLAFKRSKTSIRRATPRKREEPVEQHQEITEIPPTLKLQRKNGKYHITMCPVKKEEKTARIESVPNPIEFTIERDEDDASSTASDMEIEYSVPTAIERYRKKPNVVHVDLQVKQADILSAFKPDKGDKAKKPKGKAAKKGKKKKK